MMAANHARNVPRGQQHGLRQRLNENFNVT